MPPDKNQLLTIKELAAALHRSDDTNLCEVLPDKIARRLAERARPPCITIADLRRLNHRSILAMQNCGWGTLRQMQLCLSKSGVEWPGYRIPYPSVTPSAPRMATTGTRALGFVYLARTATHAFTKIGFSTTPTFREATLQAEDPQLRFAYTVEASGVFETWLHHRYADRRIRGEWFNLSPSEADFISSGAALSAFNNPQHT